MYILKLYIIYHLIYFPRNCKLIAVLYELCKVFYSKIIFNYLSRMLPIVFG